MSIRYLLLSSVVLISCGKSGTIEDTSDTITTDSGTTDTATGTTTDTSTTDTSTTATGTTTIDTGTTTTDTGTGSTTTTDTGGWEPMQGRYTLEPGSMIDNTCGDAFEAPEAGDTAPAVFGWNGDKINIKLDDFPRVECDWEFPAFPVCLLAEEAINEQGTIITFKNSMDGEWSQPELMSGIFYADIDCSGSSCDMFANQLNIPAFPCQSSFGFTGEL